MLWVLYRAWAPDALFPDWPRGGVVTQRTANPCTPVRFRPWPPLPTHCFSNTNAKSAEEIWPRFVSHVLHSVLVVFQRFPKRSGTSARHERDTERARFCRSHPAAFTRA